MLEYFEGFGNTLGFGERPAIIVVDFINAFTDPSCQLGSDLSQQLQSTKELLTLARSYNIPIIFTTVEYEPHLVDGGLFVKKIPALTILKEGSHYCEIDTCLEKRDDEVLIKKKFASAFFGTSLSSMLTSLKVDTLLITGCTTSGCIRATAVDAMQYGLYGIVVEECVGDRSASAHKASLSDIHTKYGDVIKLEQVKDYMNHLGGKAHVPSSS